MGCTVCFLARVIQGACANSHQNDAVVRCHDAIAKRGWIGNGGLALLTLQECLEFCELTEDEIHAIAEHEHIPEVVAAELGECLLRSDVGTWVIKRYLLEEIEKAQSHGQVDKVARLNVVLERFNASHPTYNLR